MGWRFFLFVPGWMATCTWEAWVWSLRVFLFYDEDGHDCGPLLEGGYSLSHGLVFLSVVPRDIWLLPVHN